MLRFRKYQFTDPNNGLQLSEQAQHDSHDIDTIREELVPNVQAEKAQELLEVAKEKGDEFGYLAQHGRIFRNPEPFSQQVELIESCRTTFRTAVQHTPANSNKSIDEVSSPPQEAPKTITLMHHKSSDVDKQDLKTGCGDESRQQFQQAKLLIAALNEIQEHAQCTTKVCRHRSKSPSYESITETASVAQTHEKGNEEEDWFKTPAEALEAIERCWAVFAGFETEEHRGKRKEETKVGNSRQQHAQITPSVTRWKRRSSSGWAKLENGMAVSCNGETTTRRQRKKELKSYRPLNNIRTSLEKSIAESKKRSARESSKVQQEIKQGQVNGETVLQFFWGRAGFRPVLDGIRR